MAVATLFFDLLTTLNANAGGAIQALPTVLQNGGKVRSAVASLTLATQAIGTTFGVARIPCPFTMRSIMLLTDTSLATTTIALGDTNTANKWLAAQVFTAVNVPTLVGNAASLGVQQDNGWDAVLGTQPTPYAPGGGGAFYEDITMLTAVATLPASGTLKIFFEYMID